MAARIPEQDVHTGPETLFQLLPSLWVCHPLFRHSSLHFMPWQQRLLVFFHLVWYLLEANAAWGVKTTKNRNGWYSHVSFGGCL